MVRKSLLALALVCGLATSALAVPTITVGDWIMQPNMANQKTAILISDDGLGTPIPGLPPGQIAGVDLSLLIGGGVAGPIITAIDLIGPGTIFNASNVGQTDFPDPFGPPSRQILSFTSSVSPATVNANGVLAYITVDTTGVPYGTYSIDLSSADLGPTDVGNADVLPILVNGLFLGPEPASVVMAITGAAALGAVVIRKRRARG